MNTRLRIAAGWLLMCAALHPAQAEDSRNGLVVTSPNGYANLMAEDLALRSVTGPVRWSRSWNGQEWKFNPHWESLSQSWSNLTGSQTQDSSGSLASGNSGSSGVVLDTPAPSSTGSISMSGGGGEGCWVWVDEDWQPTYAAIEVSTGLRDAGPMIPLRSTPFNRVMPEAGSDYAPGMRVSVDYASLCAGSSSASGAVSMEGIRRINELHLGDNGRYSFNNRTVLEKRAVRQQAPATVASLSTGQVALAPVTNDKGYRWIDRTGSWIDYNTQGQVVAYGDRNDNTVWLVRDGSGTLRGVVDATGRVLFTLHYTGELLTEVRDYPVAGLTQDLPARSVRYAYDERNRLVQVTDARGNVLKYDYDIANHIVRITDQEDRVEQLIYAGETVKKRTAPDGGVTEYEFDYDDTNKQFISKITGPETPAGRRVEDVTQNRAGKLVRRLFNGQTEAEIRYDTGARAESMTNARGFTTRTTRNEFDQPVEVVNPDGSMTRYAYSALNLAMTESVDEAGIKTTYVRDARGNLIKSIEAAGSPDERVTEYELNASGRPVKITRKGRTEANGTVSADAAWQLEFDDRGLIRKTIDPEGHSRTYVFDRAGNTVGYTDPRGNTTAFEVDATGQLVKLTNALGQVSTLNYDKVGNALSQINPRGKTARAAYDSMDRATRYTNEVGGSFKVRYDAEGLPAQETDEDGLVTALEYDNLLRVTKEVDALGNATKYSYQVPDGSQSGQRGSLQSPTEITYPTFTQRTRYDARERATSETLLNPNALGTEGLVSSATYDARGFVTSETDPNGKTRFYAYNAFGQTIAATDSLGAKSTALYDVRGNLMQVTDAKGNATRYEYDRADRLVKQVLPLGQSLAYRYDAAGNLEQFTDALGNRSAFERDELNRVRKALHYGSAGTLQKTTEFTWDAESNLTAWSETDHVRSQTTGATLAYDDANRKLSETVTYPAGNTLHYGYEYSDAGRKKRLIWADGTQIDYAYSAHGELETVTIPGEGSISVNQFKWTAPTQVTLPGGTVQEKSYDGLLNLEGLKVKTAGQQVTLNLQNTFGKVQELKQNIRTESAGGASRTKAGTYAFDDETRLTQAQADNGAFGTTTENFTLDAVGNRVAHSEVTGAWTYDANNRLIQRGTGANASTYAYDDAGNLTKKVEPGGKVTQYGYDSQNQLSEVSDGGGALIARYGYDPMGRRIWKERYRDAAGNALSPARRVSYLYADEALIAEATQDITLNADASVTANGAVGISAQYGPTPDADFGTDVLFVKTMASNGQEMVAYYHHDQLGAPIQATNKAGDVVWSANYNVFGLAQITTPTATGEKPTIVSNLRLPGQYYDDETGLHYNYFRYYDTSTGRYTQEDPVGLDGGLNRYVYVGGNPLTGMDPYGLFDITNPADWPTLPQGAVDGIAGFGDGMLEVVTLGLWDGDWVRNKLDIGSVDSCSDAYGIGKVVGEVTATVVLARARNPCNSFSADTLIHVRPKMSEALAAGRGRTVLKPIAALSVGDEVLAFNEWVPQLDKSDVDARLSYEKVVDIYTSLKAQTIVRIELDGGRVLTATAGHPFKTEEGWRDAILLKRGGKLLLKGSGDDEDEQLATIVDVRTEVATLPVFNLEVANAHTFFVGEEGALVHNGRCKVNFSVKHPSRKRAKEAAEHPHPGKKLPQPKKDAPKAKRDAYEDQQKYRNPESHPNSNHPDPHFHDRNKGRSPVNPHHTW